MDLAPLLMGELYVSEEKLITAANTWAGVQHLISKEVDRHFRKFSLVRIAEMRSDRQRCKIPSSALR